MTDLASATRDFVRDSVLVLEDEHDGDAAAAGGDALRVALQGAARAAGVFGPHVPVELGGHGLGMVARAPVFEEAGYSLFGPLALNAAAPDEGNVHLLDVVATDDQRSAYLAPLARGDVRSAFAMTEPSPGAGSDPSLLATSADRVPGGWRITGRKTFITGADGAAFLIVMARTSGEPGGPGGATLFLVEAETPGLAVGRHVPTMDRSMLGGHCDVHLDGVEVPDDAVLGEVDRGFAHAQVRLGPARMTHAMRWLGAARRAHECALEYAADRPAFGLRLGELGMVQRMLGENEIDLRATRALLMEACHELDAGGRASEITSVAKAFAGEALYRVADRSVQVCGGLGVTADLPAARVLRELRPFRVYDGPTEVHLWSIARRALRRHAERRA
ncbi:MAG: acyl-CoA dehydrogenase family protein [Nocardioides sp.]